MKNPIKAVGGGILLAVSSVLLVAGIGCIYFTVKLNQLLGNRDQE